MNIKLTKYKHACALIEVDQNAVVLDPGIFSDDFKPKSNINAIVISHVHSDHFDENKILAITNLNPNATIFTTQQVAEKLPPSLNIETPHNGQEFTIDKLKLNFLEIPHAIIHKSLPKIQNIGVIINDCIYYGGDSLKASPRPMAFTLIPVSAPWLKASEVIDLINNTPINSTIIPTHDDILSANGKDIIDSLISNTKTNQVGNYKRLLSGESIDIALE